MNHDMATESSFLGEGVKLVCECGFVVDCQDEAEADRRMREHAKAAGSSS